MIKIEEIRKPILAVKWTGSKKSLNEIRDLVAKSNKSMTGGDDEDKIITLHWVSKTGWYPGSNTSMNVHIGDYVYLDENRSREDDKQLYKMHKEELGKTFRKL